MYHIFIDGYHIVSRHTRKAILSIAEHYEREGRNVLVKFGALS